MPNILKVNDLLRQKIAAIIAESLQQADMFITVSYVLCSENLASARIGITVFPELKEKPALAALKKNTGFFMQKLLKETRMRKIPKLIWQIDQGQKHAREIDEILRIASEG
jgi:ribosome-binding factor A